MESELIFDGKTYISATRASRNFGYNPDYIGQLCRKGLIECRRVGRLWFVNPESLKIHEIEAVASKKQKIESRIAAKGHNTFVRGLVKEPTVSANTFKAAFKSANYDYKDFYSHLDSAKGASFAKQLTVGIVSLMLVFGFASNVVSFRSLEITKFYLSNNTLNTTFSYLKSFGNQTGESISYQANIFQSSSQTLVQGFSNLRNLVSNKTKTFFGFLKTDFKLVLSGDQRSEVESRKSSNTRESGLVVVPSTGDSELDSKVKDYVQTSFSDETKIVPDEFGNSGVIKPVFRSEEEQEYVYILVPVDDSGG